MQFKFTFFLLSFTILSIISNSQNNLEYIIIGNIHSEGNKITKDHIIKRELTFQTGDTINKVEFENVIERNKDNILNTSLFNFVDIKGRMNKSNLLDITIYLEERWYIWPYPILEHADRNFSNFINDQDWNRINYGGYISVYNMRGRNEYLKVKARYGYKEQLGFTYAVPFFDKSKKNGLSLFLAHNRQKEISYSSVYNKLLYYRNDEDYLYNSNEIDLEYTFRNKLYYKHILDLRYNNAEIIDTISALNNDYFKAGNLNTEYFSINYAFIFDNRDLAYYPTKGKYYTLNITKNGINLLDNEDVNNFKISSTINNYYKLTNRLFYASKMKGLKTIGDIEAYYFDNALGYDDVLRGYEYYVIHGQDYCLFKNSLKWNIIPNKVKTINAIPFTKFRKVHYSVHADIFYDSGYVWDSNYFTKNNFLANQYIYSGGIGLNFVTYYDKVFILEFSVNKFGEAGIFINFEAPI